MNIIYNIDGNTQSYWYSDKLKCIYLKKNSKVKPIKYKVIHINIAYKIFAICIGFILKCINMNAQMFIKY